METKSIDKLKAFEGVRKNNRGYIANSDSVRIKYENLKYVTIAGAYDNMIFDKYIKKAIQEKEKELIARAFELEECEYKETKKLAKIEAANILAGENLL